MTHLLNISALNSKEMSNFLNLVLKKWLYINVVTILFILVGTCTPSVGAVEDYKGTYSGTYSGTDYGTWTARYISQGTGVGVAWSNRYNIPDVGTGAINSSGVFYATMNGGSTLSGTVASNGSVQGTWYNSLTGQSGTLSGRKNLPAELQKFEGNYEGTFSGSDSGTWNAAIDSEGSCSGNVWSETDQQNYSGAGIINYTGEFISEVSNRAIQHGIINSAGNVQGTWYIPSGGSGTLTGSKVSAIKKPTVTTGSAIAVTSSTATLNGTVNPNGAGTTYYFQYGTTTGYGSTTSSTSAGSGTSNVSASASLTGLSSNTTYHFRLVGTNSAGTNYGSDQTFATSGSAPTVTTGSATSVSMSSATLNGTVNPNGSSTTYYFEYGTSISYNMTTTSTNAGSGTSTVSVGVPVTGLISCTTYHFRVRASNNAGTSYGDDQAFTTTIIYVEPFGSCGGNSPCYSTIQDAVDEAWSGGVIRIAKESYGEDLTLGSSGNVMLEGGWDSSFTTRYFTAESSTSTAITGTMTVTGEMDGALFVDNIVIGTESSQLPPTVSTGSAISVTATSATLNGTVNPNGSSTTYYFQYGTTTSYGSTTTNTGASSGASDVSVSAPITGLSSNTTYHFRLVATNSGGTSYGSDGTFSTAGSSGSETEPNNDKATADPLISGQDMGGQLSSRSDEDWFSISTSGAAIINVQFAENISSNSWYVSVQNDSGDVLSNVIHFGSTTSTQFSTAVSQGGKYYVIITAYSWSGADYTLAVTTSSGTAESEGL